MNEFKVAWDKGMIELKTREAAEHLRQCFLEEGREAKVFGRISPASDWKEMVPECS